MIKRVIRFGSRLTAHRPIDYYKKTNFAQFATLYELAKRNLPNQQVYRSTSIRFENQGIKMLAYQFSPQILEDNNPSFNKRQHILNSKMFILSFLSDVGDGMEEDAWKNRKVMSFNLKECFQLFKIADLKQQKIVIDQDQASESPQITQNYTYYMEATYNKQKEDVEIWITHHCQREQNKTHVWDVNFVLRHNEYRVLCEWIRSGIYYSSGTAFMIEYSKQHQILMHSTNSQKEVPKKKKK